MRALHHCLVAAVICALACTATATLQPSSESLSISSPSCASKTLVPLVTQCAKRSDAFLKCVGRGNPGSLRQCSCIQESDFMQQCIGECLPNVYQVLCTRVWHPRSSKYLEYEGTREALQGIDGVYVVNLPRRADRLARFIHAAPFQTGDFQLVTAFDGKELTWDDHLNKIFGNNKFKTRRGVIGQALSHLQLWKHIADSTDEFHLILEDDVEFAPGFLERWNTEMHHAFPVDAQIIFLGGVLDSNKEAYVSGNVLRRVSRHFNEHIENGYFSHDRDEDEDIPEEGEQPKPSKAFHYKPIAYILSSKGAKDLVQYVKDHGFTQPTGVLLMKLMRKWENVFATFPLVAHEQNVNPAFVGGIDSDIQFDANPVATTPYPSLSRGAQSISYDSKPSQQQQSQPVQQTSGAIPTTPAPPAPPTSTSRTTHPSMPATPSSTASSATATQQQGNVSSQRPHANQDVRNSASPPKPTPQQTESTSQINTTSTDALLSSGVVKFGYNSLPVAVITLPSSQDRLSRFRESTVAARLRYFVHSATDGRSLSLDRLLQRGLVQNGVPSDRMGTIAQALSHLLFLEKLAKSSYRAALVLEDDASVNRDIVMALGQALAVAPNDWDMIFLGCSALSCFAEGDEEWFVRPQPECDIGAFAYVVKQAAAPSIMKDILPLSEPIGATFASSWFLEKYGVFCLNPPLAQEQSLRPDRSVRDTANN
eukprot:m.180788 g.180788  ORF g.180788 m.180788 type:complete len:708 (+) comp16619_c0_seq14:44-2167(+)